MKRPLGSRAAAERGFSPAGLSRTAAAVAAGQAPRGGGGAPLHPRLLARPRWEEGPLRVSAVGTGPRVGLAQRVGSGRRVARPRPRPAGRPAQLAPSEPRDWLPGGSEAPLSAWEAGPRAAHPWETEAGFPAWARGKVRERVLDAGVITPYEAWSR